MKPVYDFKLGWEVFWIVLAAVAFVFIQAAVEFAVPENWREWITNLLTLSVRAAGGALLAVYGVRLRKFLAGE